MDIYNEKNSAQFQAFIDKVNGMADGVRKAGHEKEAQGLQAIAANFKMKTEDFYRKNRKLNIGVVGQVKAGKSSFLNTLLFGGKEVLPKAATPKTATLTKMEYAEENSIDIEYYSAEDWKILEQNAKVDRDEVIFTSSRELVQMAAKNGIDPNVYIAKGMETIPFSSYDDLVAHLNDYVGADGRVTPLVKAVTLHLHKEEFKGLSIVDTPGLNDPIVSRTIRTREFMEVCDVVFFLSQAGSFLDKSDWDLLSAQLPAKGVKRLVLIASKYDSGIRDILRVQDPDDVFGEDENSTDSIPKACKLIRKKLTKRAKMKVEEFVEQMAAYGSDPVFLNVIRQCAKPIMVSAMAYNMSQKPESDYTKEEQNLAAGLRLFTHDWNSDLKLLGNFNEVEVLFNEVAREKDAILEEKSNSFIPTAEEELRENLRKYKKQAEKHLQILLDNDQAQLMKKKKAVESQMGGIKADIASVFGEVLVNLESERIKGVQELRESCKDYAHIDVRTGTKTKTRSYTTGYLLWEKRHYYSYDEHYSYFIATDAVENLQKYTVEATTRVENVFTASIALQGLKRKLLNVVIQNFDTGSENYDVSLFRLITENAVNSVDFPVFSLDISTVMSQITGQFNGEITKANEKMKLVDALQQSLADVFGVLAAKLDQKAMEFKKKIQRIQQEVSDAMLQNVADEFDSLLKQCEHKEKEVAGYKAYIQLLNEELKQLG